MFTFDFFLLFVFISCSYCLLIRVLVARVLAPICSAPWSADGTEGEKSFCFSWVGCPEILLDGEEFRYSFWLRVRAFKSRVSCFTFSDLSPFSIQFTVLEHFFTSIR